MDFPMSLLAMALSDTSVTGLITLFTSPSALKSPLVLAVTYAALGCCPCRQKQIITRPRNTISTTNIEPTHIMTKKRRKLHVWLRTDRARVEFYAHGDVGHQKLNEVMERIGGCHVDVIVGNCTKGYKQIGLALREGWVRTHPNGDDAPIMVYYEPYRSSKKCDKLRYVGIVKDRRFSLTGQAIRRIG